MGGAKEITIDDVVKFIHDNTENPEVDIPTKYDDIKHISDIITEGENLVKGTAQEITDFFESAPDNIVENYSILTSTNYNIIVVSKINPK